MARPRRWSFFMPLEEHRFIQALTDLYRGLLTLPGQALLWSTVAAGILLLGGLIAPLVFFFSFCAGALLSAVLVGWPFRPRLTLSRRLPPPVSAGDELLYSVVVHNPGRLTARSIAIEERRLPLELRPLGEPPLIDSLAPGERREVVLRLQCRLRGAYELKALQAASLFPSALFKWPRRSPTRDRLLVYPRFERLQSFELPVGHSYQPGGIPVASQVGESTEFAGTREWREGDRTRDIHWPSFARTGRLVVREFQEEYFVRLALVLDVESRSAEEDERFERSLSLAAAIADVLARQEYIIDIFAAGPQVFHFQAGRALAHFENILEILACLEPGDRLDPVGLESALLPQAEQLSAVILVVMHWEPSRAGLVNRLKERGLAVRVLCVHPEQRPEGLAPEELVELP